MYYDEKKKRWVIDGEDESEDDVPPPPPPVSVQTTKTEQKAETARDNEPAPEPTGVNSLTSAGFSGALANRKRQ